MKKRFKCKASVPSVKGGGWVGGVGCLWMRAAKRIFATGIYKRYVGSLVGAFWCHDNASIVVYIFKSLWNTTYTTLKTYINAGRRIHNDVNSCKDGCIMKQKNSSDILNIKWIKWKCALSDQTVV